MKYDWQEKVVDLYILYPSQNDRRIQSTLIMTVQTTYVLCNIKENIIFLRRHVDIYVRVNLIYIYYYTYFKVTFYATLDILNSTKPYAYIQKMTLNLIQTIKTSMYNTNHTQNT